VTAPVDYLVQQSFLVGAKETSWNTPVTTPTFSIPLLQPKWSPKLKWLPDVSMVGSPTETRDLVPGKRYDELTFKSNMYTDSIGNQLLAVLGAADVVAGTGPYTHTFKLLNNGAVGSQPPSYTLQYYDSSVTREIAGARLATFDIAWSADGAVECTNTWQGAIESDLTATPTNTVSTKHFVPGWSVGITTGGTAFTIMVSGNISITRSTEPIWVSDATQGPHQMFDAAIKVSGKVKFVVETSGFNPFTGSNSAMVRNQLVTVITFTDPVSNDSVALTMSACQFMNPTTDAGSKYYQVDAEFEAVGNTTDAVSGISPIAAVLTNGQSTAY
jgi:hypothetical protein